MNLRADHGAQVAAEHGMARSVHWPTREHHFLAAHPHCIACPAEVVSNGIFAHQVHHAVVPFHIAIAVGRADLELDFRNLCTLCETPEFEHHLLLGHLKDFKSYNPEVSLFCRDYFGQTKFKILSSPRFLEASHRRPKLLKDMTPEERQALRAHLDEILPPDPAVVDLLSP